MLAYRLELRKQQKTKTRSESDPLNGATLMVPVSAFQLK